MGRGVRARGRARLPEARGMSDDVSSASPALERRSPSRVAALVRARAWPLVVWTAMLGWSLALFATVRSDYLEFRLARFDLGNMVQAVWSTAHGRPLEMTDASGRADHPPREPRRSDPRRCSRRSGSLAPTPAHARRGPDRGVRARRAPRLLARSPPPRLGEGRRPARARVPRLSVARLDGARRLPPGDARDPALSLRDLVPRHGPALAPSPSARSWSWRRAS